MTKLKRIKAEDEMSAISFIGVSADEKEALLGPEFRNIEVLDFDSVDVENESLPLNHLGG